MTAPSQEECRRCGMPATKVSIGDDGLCRDCSPVKLTSQSVGNSALYKRLRVLRKTIDAEDAARDERLAIWRLLAASGVTQAQIAAASPGVDQDAVQKALKRGGEVQGDPFGLAGLDGTMLYARLVRVSRKIAKAKVAREERATIWQELSDAKAPLDPIAAASGVHKTFILKDLRRRAAKVAV
jgi:hypothetical protein